MKCAIFFFFAFCAFESVFADNSADDSPDYLVDTGHAWQKLDSDVWAAAKAAKIKKVRLEDLVVKCWSYYDAQQFSKKTDIALTTCLQCDHKGKKNGNNKSAPNCCKEAYDKVNKEAKSLLALAKTCIAKCAQSVAECHKEIEKQQKTISEIVKKGGNLGETKI